MRAEEYSWIRESLRAAPNFLERFNEKMKMIMWVGSLINVYAARACELGKFQCRDAIEYFDEIDSQDVIIFYTAFRRSRVIATFITSYGTIHCSKTTFD